MYLAMHMGFTDDHAGAQGISVACRLVLERRMRIMTVALPVASAHADVYCHVNADALLTMLVHKIGNVVLQQGLEQGQGLLQDWLVLFVAAYNSHRGIQPKLPQEVRCFGCVKLT